MCVAQVVLQNVFFLRALARVFASFVCVAERVAVCVAVFVAVCVHSLARSFTCRTVLVSKLVCTSSWFCVFLPLGMVWGGYDY